MTLAMAAGVSDALGFRRTYHRVKDRKMAYVDYMHVCDYAFCAEGGKPCIIGIFNFIWAPTFPTNHPAMCVVATFQGRAHEVIPFSIEMVRPNGDVIARKDGTATASDDGGAFVSVNMVDICIPEEGRYCVRVSSGGQVLTSRSMRALREQAPRQFQEKPGRRSPN